MAENVKIGALILLTIIITMTCPPTTVVTLVLAQGSCLASNPGAILLTLPCPGNCALSLFATQEHALLTTLPVDEMVGHVHSGNQRGTVTTLVAAEVGAVKQLIIANRPVALQLAPA